MTPVALFAEARRAHERGHLAETQQYCLQILKLQPQHSDAFNLLGLSELMFGSVKSATELFSRAIQINPNSASYLANLAIALRSSGHLDASIETYKKALALDPLHPDAMTNYASALAAKGDTDLAIGMYRRAIAAHPSNPVTFNNFGNALNGRGDREEAIEAYWAAIRLRPDYLVSASNLQVLLLELGRVGMAADLCRQMQEHHPDNPNLFNNLGNLYKSMGRLDLAVPAYEEATKRAPTDPIFAANLIYCLSFAPESTAGSIKQAAEAWDQRYASQVPRQSHSNNRDPDRRLKIGYVAPTFRAHVVGFNILPLFREHDREHIETIAYATAAYQDPITEEFKKYSDQWKNVVSESDECLAEIIAADEVDVLVDLNMYLSGMRPLLFAMKPAPIEMAFAAYPGTTGQRAIDYRISDPYLDPIGETENDYTEKTLRLPHSFWCYDPTTMYSGTGVTELPKNANGFVTFGCLNNFAKVNAEVLHQWGRVLAAVPDSQLMLLTGTGPQTQWVTDILAEHGIGEGRLRFISQVTRSAYLEFYRQMDLMLDSWPYNGHTTSLDALWNGVPVVTRVGETIVGRAGVSQLTNLGLTDFIARNNDQFVQLAVDLANDTPRLASLRLSLRDRMRASPICDAKEFARGMERLYRQAWQEYCLS